MTKIFSSKFAPVIALTILVSFAPVLRADLGGDNPTGTSGQYNGNITTGCSYDPYTGNATRSITDLVVAGGVGTYPLAFTRTMNSRYTVGLGNKPAFGSAGTWTFSYQWSIDTATVVNTGGVGKPAAYNVNYPDGRRVIFQNMNTAGDPDFRGPKGIRDRFEKLQTGATECYLRLSDGGKVWFHADISTTTSGNKYTSVYTFSFKGIIDPYGQTTTITYPADGSLTITEPAGRTIKVFSRTISSTSQGALGDGVVDHVTGSDGRTVQYNYTAYVTANGTRYTSLTSVVYFGDTSLNATYTYQPGNTDPNGRPLIATCIDPMFDGPMWKIAYEFKPNAAGVVYGQLYREKSYGGIPVSTLAIVSTTNPSSRSETRGDNPMGAPINPTRTFTYNTYRLKETTDFRGVTEYHGYSDAYYLQTVTDRNGHATVYNANILNGNVEQINYPIPGDGIPTGTATRICYNYGAANAADPNNRDANNPYYLSSISNGSGVASQTFYRDISMRVTSIAYIAPFAYAYGFSESFTYNSFGQVLTRTTKMGFPESYQYDSAGRIQVYRDAAHATGNPTARYQYDSFGRVSGITEPRGSSSGDSNYTTTFLYNARGQLTRLTHPDGTYVQYGYNPNGTLAWTADERHAGGASDPNQRTSYTYDDYKRLRSVTTPLRGTGDSTPRTTTYFYDQAGTGEDYTRTAAVPTKVFSPGGKVTTYTYDGNLRALSVTAVGDSNVPDAVTSYTYDDVGNVRTVKDPNGQSSGAVTTYNYDQMDRVASIDDPIPADRNTQGHTVRFNYDLGSHVVQEFRADDKMKQYIYDDAGRCYQIWDFGSTWDIATDPVMNGHGSTTCASSHGTCTKVNEIDYVIDADGNVVSIAVPNPTSKYYTFTFDELGRKTSETYPLDYSGTTRTETYHYDVANHLDWYRNPAGQTKTLTYDNRGRLTDTSWTNDPTKGATGPAVHISYDSTRPTGITTTAYTVAGITLPATTLGFGYDEANNRTYEDQTITGLPTRRVQTLPDADGSRKSLVVSTGGTTNFANNFEYTNRNELRNINNGASGNGQPLFTYSYDASGNVTQRLGRTLSGDTTTTVYDAINRATDCTHAINGTNFSASHYDYSKLGNLKDVIRGSSAYEDGKGDYFNAYDDGNELTAALYSAASSADPNPGKSVSYGVLNKRRDSMTVTDNTVTPSTTNSYVYVHNDLNQYSKIVVNGTDRLLQHDYNFNLTSYNGWTYSYDAENRLVSVGGSHNATFAYDAVGRCVRRLIDNATTVLTYDQWTPVVEWDGSGNLVATNVYGLGDDEILYRLAGPTQTYYKSDPMGNVRFLLNGNGAVIEKCTYDAFGSPTITQFNGSQPTGNRFMFSGREFFSSLGLYDFRNRIYDPVMGRFYQTDPIGFEGDPTNLYRFCGNNPLLGGDPIGLDGLDTGSPLSFDQFGGSGEFSDMSSFGQSWFAAGGVGLDLAGWASLEDPTAGDLGSQASIAFNDGGRAVAQTVDPTSFISYSTTLVPLAPADNGNLISNILPDLEKTLKDWGDMPIFEGGFVGKAGVAVEAVLAPRILRFFEALAAKKAATLPKYLYYYTDKETAALIEKSQLGLPGVKPTFLTTARRLTPLQAQIELALPPKNTAQALFRISTKGLDQSKILLQRRVPGNVFNRAGGGFEVLFEGPIPLEHVTRFK